MLCAAGIPRAERASHARPIAEAEPVSLPHMGLNFVGHAYVGHHYTGHSYIGHNYLGP